MAIPTRFRSPPGEKPSTMSSAMWIDNRRIESRDVTVSITAGFMGCRPVGSRYGSGASYGLPIRRRARPGFGSDRADPPDPEASETPFVVDASPERAGPTDEGGTDAAGSLGSSGSLLGAEISTPNEPT